jgi:hypothetical protein
MGERASRLRRILGWLVPFLGATVALGVQVIIPRLLQVELVGGQYTAFVAISAVAAYVSLADVGLSTAVLPGLSALHGAGRRAAFAWEAGRIARVFLVTALIGALFAAVMLQTAPIYAEGAPGDRFEWSGLALIASNAMLLALGSHHAAVLFATGRLVQAQIASLASSIAPQIAMVLTVIVTRRLDTGIVVMAIMTGLAAMVRAAHSRAVVRRETAGAAADDYKPVPLSHLVTAGMALRAATALPSSAYPHLLSVLAVSQVDATVPARTFVNGCRIVGQQFVNVLAVYVTRKMAGDDTSRAQGRHAYVVTSSFLAGVHLLLIAFAGALAVPVFRAWLPHHAPIIRDYLPGLLMEQALVAAVAPTTILYMARNQLRALGVVLFAGAVVGLASMPIALQLAPRAGYGISFAISAIPWFVIGARAEHRTFADMTGGGRLLSIRYVAGGIAALAAAWYGVYPWVAVIAIAATSLSLLPASLVALRAVFFGSGLDRGVARETRA